MRKGREKYQANEAFDMDRDFISEERGECLLKSCANGYNQSHSALVMVTCTPLRMWLARRHCQKDDIHKQDRRQFRKFRS